MPTKEWFRENPKVSAYISQDLYSKLEEYMRREGIKKVSQGVTAILEKTLSPTNQPETKENQAEKKLKQEVDQLKSKVNQIELLISKALRNDISAQAIVRQEERSKYNQLTIDQAEIEKQAATEKQESTNKQDQDPEVDLIKPKVIQKPRNLTTKEVEKLTGISRKKLESRKKKNQLPYTEGNFTIVRWVEKQTAPPHSNIWEVQEALSS